MLLHLVVENFVIVDKLELDFSNGLCVITGETGAGKSLIVDAIEAIFASKISSENIKTNAKYSYIEASFVTSPKIHELLTKEGFEDIEETFTISRTLKKAGSKSRINGQIVSQSFTKSLGEYLLSILGQNENQSLFKVETHREIVDLLGNKEHKNLLAKVKKIFFELDLVKKEYNELLKNSQDNKKQLDFFKFQLKEIDSANLQIGEDEKLKQEREILVHSEELIQNLSLAYNNLYAGEDSSNLFDSLNNVCKLIENSARYDLSLQPISSELETIASQLKEISSSIRDKIDTVETDPEYLSQVEARLDNINNMKKKYGLSIKEILVYADDLRKKLEKIENHDEILSELLQKIEILKLEYLESANKLSHSRKLVSNNLEPKIEKELSELGMEKTIFKVDIKESSFTEFGIDNLEFLICSNPGEPLRPLYKVASGGETSRIMLALEMVLYKINSVPTLIFDEIDSGISGKTALIVSQKLAKLSKSVQIICITHLPVIASMSEQHIWIEKTLMEDYTIVHISQLSEKLRLEKLAQMSSGNINKSSLKYAEEIYANAKNYKVGLK